MLAVMQISRCQNSPGPHCVTLDARFVVGLCANMQGKYPDNTPPLTRHHEFFVRCLKALY